MSWTLGKKCTAHVHKALGNEDERLCNLRMGCAESGYAAVVGSVLDN